MCGDRVPLTTADALAGVQPPPFGFDEWAALNAACRAYAGALDPHSDWLARPDFPPSCYVGGSQTAHADR